jgi:hypothetical protein
MTDSVSWLRGNAALCATALLSSGATLVCCVLPVALVTLGAGAALAGLVSAVPQLIWLSLHKGWVFGVAGGLLIASGVSLWRARKVPCPADTRLAALCTRLRRVSVWLYALASVSLVLGATFAFVLPILDRP